MPVSTSMPDAIVEIAFTTDPGDPVPSWTDVSAYVEASQDGGPIVITRGRSDELGEIQPSQMTVTLDNSDGRFTAGYASGAYYPNVLVGRRIRVTSSWLAVRRYRFDGYINEWPTVWPDGTHVKSTVTITASSRQATLGNRRPLKSIIEQEYLLDSPVLYYPLNEPAEAVNASSTIPADYGTRLNTVGSGTDIVFGNATGPGTDGYTAATFASGKYLRRGFANDAVAAGVTAVSVECAFVTTDPTGPLVLLATDATSGPNVLGLSIAGGNLIAQGQIAGTNPGVASAGTVNDGLVHHAAVVIVDEGAQLRLYGYIDGALISSSVAATASIPRFGGLVVGGDTFSGTIAHVAVYDTELTGARVAEHSEATLTGFAGESSDARLERLATYAGIDPSFWVLENGVAHVDNQFTEGTSAFELMQQVVRTEDGLLFDDAGYLVFHNREHRVGASSSMTLSVSAGEVEGDVTIKLDNQGVYNDVTAQSGDDTTRVTNETSIDAYGVYDRQLDVLTTTDEELQNAAENVLAKYAEPLVRSPQLSVSVNTLSSAQLALLLARQLGDRISVSNLPAQAPASTMDFFIEGLTESIGAETYFITYNLSPASLSDVWILQDATYGVLDSTTILGL